MNSDTAEVETLVYIMINMDEDITGVNVVEYCNQLMETYGLTFAEEVYNTAKKVYQDEVNQAVLSYEHNRVLIEEQLIDEELMLPTPDDWYSYKFNGVPVTNLQNNTTKKEK